MARYYVPVESQTLDKDFFTPDWEMARELIQDKEAEFKEAAAIADIIQDIPISYDENYDSDLIGEIRSKYQDEVRTIAEMAQGEASNMAKITAAINRLRRDLTTNMAEGDLSKIMKTQENIEKFKEAVEGLPFGRDRELYRGAIQEFYDTARDPYTGERTYDSSSRVFEPPVLYSIEDFGEKFLQNFFTHLNADVRGGVTPTDRGTYIVWKGNMKKEITKEDIEQAYEAMKISHPDLIGRAEAGERYSKFLEDESKREKWFTEDGTIGLKPGYYMGDLLEKLSEAYSYIEDVESLQNIQNKPIPGPGSDSKGPAGFPETVFGRSSIISGINADIERFKNLIIKAFPKQEGKLDGKSAEYLYTFIDTARKGSENSNERDSANNIYNIMIGASKDSWGNLIGFIPQKQIETLKTSLDAHLTNSFRAVRFDLDFSNAEDFGSGSISIPGGSEDELKYNRITTDDLKTKRITYRNEEYVILDAKYQDNSIIPIKSAVEGLLQGEPSGEYGAYLDLDLMTVAQYESWKHDWDHSHRPYEAPPEDSEESSEKPQEEPRKWYQRKPKSQPQRQKTEKQVEPADLHDHRNLLPNAPRTRVSVPITINARDTGVNFRGLLQSAASTND